MVLTDFPRRVSAQDAFSLRLVLLGLPLAVIGQFVYWEPGQSFGGLLAASCVGYAAFGLILGSARLGARGIGATELSSGVVAGVGAIAGLVRAGLSIALWTAVGGGALTGADVLPRLIAASLLGACLVPIGGLLLERLREFRQGREQLRTQLFAAEYAALMADARGEALRELINGEIATQVDRAIATVIGDPLDQESEDFAVLAARRMRKAASDVERPDARDRELGHAGRHRLSGYIGPWRAALCVNPLPTGIVIPLWISTAFPAQLAHGSLGKASFVTAMGVVAIALTFTLARKMIEGAPGRWAMFSVGAVIAASSLASIAWAVAFPDQDWQTFALNVVIGTIWLGFLTLLMSVAMAAIYRASSVMEELGRQVSVAQARARASQAAERELRKRASAMLHSDVQGRLYGVALYVEQPDFLATPTWVRTQLDALPRHLADGEGETLTQILEQHFARWSGILRIDHVIEVDPHDPQTRLRIVSVIDEALTNAFRHGRARNVWVHVTAEDEQAGGTIAWGTGWRVVVVNDGVPPAGRIQSGLGSSLLEDMTQGKWSLQCGAEGTGAILTATVT